MTLWFTSDTHYNHQKALEIMPFRPWKTIEEMNQGLIDNYNSKVSPEDICIFLGDIVLGRDKVHTVPEILGKLNGHKVMVYGNHDMAFDDNREGKRQAAIELYKQAGMEEVYLEAIMLDIVCERLDIILPEHIKHKVLLSHFPFYSSNGYNQEHDAKYKPCFPLEDNKLLLLSGHTHQKAPIDKNFRNINIGVDAWNWYPVSLDTIMKLYWKDIIPFSV